MTSAQQVISDIMEILLAEHNRQNKSRDTYTFYRQPNTISELLHDIGEVAKTSGRPNHEPTRYE